MSAFYNKDIDSVRQEVNGSLEPLSNQQGKINQEKNGLNFNYFFLYQLS